MEEGMGTISSSGPAGVAIIWIIDKGKSRKKVTKDAR
jgi:hypothetical protein